jgi:hypothetical protein
VVVVVQVTDLLVEPLEEILQQDQQVQQVDQVFTVLLQEETQEQEQTLIQEETQVVAVAVEAEQVVLVI